MRSLSCVALLILLLYVIAPSLEAHDTIKILIPEDPSGVLHVEESQGLKGKVIELPFEKYIEGVVAAEVGKEWDIEALKAQAVISRSYAVYYKEINSGKGYHLTSTVLHQLYKGENTDPWIALAVNETEGEILTYEGKPIEAFYHSTCGGRTELPEEVWGKSYPYLKSVICVDESSPYYSWKRRFSFKEIEGALRIKGIKDISISSLTSTGRVKTLKIIIEDLDAPIEVKAVELRRLLGYRELPSTLFTIDVAHGEVTFIGQGYGHGVGLSQWKAVEMSKEGKDYREILEYFYPGTMLKKRH